MVARLVNTDLHEMAVELPVRVFSTDEKISRENYRINNPRLKASFEEIRTSRFCVSDVYLWCEDDTKMYTKAEEYNAVWFCAALQGSVTCYYDPITRGEEWNRGDANLLSFDSTDSFTCFCRNTPFQMREIMFSMDYIKELAAQYPDLFGKNADYFFCSKHYRAYRENQPFCPGICNALEDIMQSHISGNIAEMYADAKVREILSLFLCRSDEEECASCACTSMRESDKLQDARTIIEQQYLDPPSLYQLALMVGTNECTLKKGFKALFGTTVFGYLFDYRMNMACRYLLDTNKTIQEVGLCVGYEHHAHFSTAFRRKFGFSPLEYRNIRLVK